MSKIILETIIESIASRVDGTITIKLGTQELDSDNAGKLFQLRGKFCKVLLSDSNITSLEQEAVENTQLVSGKKNKTKSQRLRNALYVLHSQNGGDESDFESFYDQEMNKIIIHYQNKLE